MHGRQLVTSAGVPGQMPDAVAKMIEQRTREAEQDDLPDSTGEERLDYGKRAVPGSGADQPQRQQHGAGAKRYAGDAM